MAQRAQTLSPSLESARLIRFRHRMKRRSRSTPLQAQADSLSTCGLARQLASARNRRARQTPEAAEEAGAAPGGPLGEEGVAVRSAEQVVRAAATTLLSAYMPETSSTT